MHQKGYLRLGKTHSLVRHKPLPLGLLLPTPILSSASQSLVHCHRTNTKPVVLGQVLPVGVHLPGGMLVLPLAVALAPFMAVFLQAVGSGWTWGLRSSATP